MLHEKSADAAPKPKRKASLETATPRGRSAVLPAAWFCPRSAWVLMAVLAATLGTAIALAAGVGVACVEETPAGQAGVLALAPAIGTSAVSLGKEHAHALRMRA